MDKRVLERLIRLSYNHPIGGVVAGKPHTTIELEALRQRGLAKVDIRGLWDITDRGRDAIQACLEVLERSFR